MKSKRKLTFRLTALASALCCTLAAQSSILAHDDDYTHWNYGGYKHWNHGWYKKPNIIVILADDYGQISAELNTPTTDDAYPNAAPTPALAHLAEHGVLFENGWAMPVCSTTRGTRTLGKLPTTTGIGAPLGAQPYPADGMSFPPVMLNPDDPNTVQRLAQKAGYLTFKVGKWHEVEANPDGNAASAADVVRSGFDYFYGQIPGFPFGGYGGSCTPDVNPICPPLNDPMDPRDTWTPVASSNTGYNDVSTEEFMTSALVSRSVGFIRKAKEQGKPYYLALDFAAPHWPYEVAPGPNEPCPVDFAGDCATDWLTLDPVIHANVIQQVKDAWKVDEYPDAGTRAPFFGQQPNQVQSRAAFKSMIAYMDLQIGRLLKHVDLRHTNVIFLGDNGTQGGGGGNNVTSGNNVTEAPFDPFKQKSTVWRGGSEVPFIVAGKAVRKKGRRSDAMVTSTDVYATVLDMIGQRQPRDTRKDSISFYSVLKGHKGKRRYGVSEWFGATPSLGGIFGIAQNEGRVVGNQHFRLQARPVIREIPADSGNLYYECRDGSLQNTTDSPMPECLDENGIYQKKYFVLFFDLRNDRDEKHALLLEEMTRKQKRNFRSLCRHMNKVAWRATYVMNADENFNVCELDGSNLQTEQTNPL